MKVGIYEILILLCQMKCWNEWFDGITSPANDKKGLKCLRKSQHMRSLGLRIGVRIVRSKVRSKKLYRYQLEFITIA